MVSKFDVGSILIPTQRYSEVFLGRDDQPECIVIGVDEGNMLFIRVMDQPQFFYLAKRDMFV